MNKQIKITLLLTSSLFIIFISSILIFKGIYYSKSLADETLINSNQTLRPTNSQSTHNQNNIKNNNVTDLQSNTKDIPAKRLKTFPNQNFDQKTNQSRSNELLNNNPVPENIPKITLGIDSMGLFTIPFQENDTAFTVLLRASQQNNFTIKSEKYGETGVFISCIDHKCNQGNYYWFLYYNGKSSLVGASSLMIKNNDIINWRFEKWQ